MPFEQISPELERIVFPDQDVEVLGTGYAVGEGPLWWREDQSLLFSEVRGDRRWKWSAGEGVTLVQEPTNNANGLTRDPTGKAGDVRGRRPSESNTGRARWKRHRGSRQLSRQAVEPAQRRGGQSRTGASTSPIPAALPPTPTWTSPGSTASRPT